MSLAGAERRSDRVMNLGDLLTQAARRLPEHPGLIVGERVITWAALNARVDAAAHGLAAAGVGPGDRVLVQARNSPEMWETLWASFKLGAVWVPTNYRIHPVDIDHIAAHSGAKVLIYDDAFPDHADHARANGVETAICIGTPRQGEQTYDELVAAHLGRPFTAVPVERDDPCWFFFTSGTTGKPKAAVLSHGQMAFVVANHLADLMPGMTEADASLVVAPLSHGAGINQLVLTARAVPTVLTTSERFNPEEVFQLIEKHKISNMFTVPTILQTLTAHAAADRYDHSSLRYVIYAGAPMLRENQKAALKKLGPCIVQYFGLGEVTGNITVLPPHLHALEDDRMRVGSCGFPRTGMQIEIQDKTGKPLAPGAVGEICVTGPAVFNGYYKNDKANAEAFRDGWFCTGDLGYLDDAGYLYITGRSSDMFISGGSNIYPLEIEEKIAQHPAVTEAAVFGMADAKWGEIGIAAVALKPGHSLDLEALTEFLRPRMASYKLPRRLVLFDELPKSGYGKITRKLLRAAVEARDADGAGPA